MATVEPRHLQKGWISRTSRAALRQMLAQPLQAVILSICCPAASILCTDRIEVLGLSVVSLTLIYLFTAPSGSWRRHLPPLLALGIVSSGMGLLVAGHDYALEGPFDSFLWYGAFCTFILGLHAVTAVMTGILMLPLKIAGIVPYGTTATGTFAAFLHTDSDLAWLQSCRLGDRAVEINFSELSFFLVPLGVTAGLPLLLPYMAAVWYAIYREIFYGPTPEPSTAPLPMGKLAAAGR